MQHHTVAIIEDCPETCRRLIKVITSRPEFSLIATANTLNSAQRLLHHKIPDILLVDLGLPDGSGIEIIHEITNRSPDTEVMVISVFGDEKHVLDAIEAGAHSYLLKDESDDHIIDSLHQILQGGSPMSPTIARHLLRRLHKPSGKNHQTTKTYNLTKRELEVLKLSSKGFTYHETAKILGLSSHTVNSHFKKIYRKLAVHSCNEAVYEAKQLGLLKGY